MALSYALKAKNFLFSSSPRKRGSSEYSGSCITGFPPRLCLLIRSISRMCSRHSLPPPSMESSCFHAVVHGKDDLTKCHSPLVNYRPFKFLTSKLQGMYPCRSLVSCVFRLSIFPGDPVIQADVLAATYHK